MRAIVRNKIISKMKNKYAHMCICRKVTTAIKIVLRKVLSDFYIFSFSAAYNDFTCYNFPFVV